MVGSSRRCVRERLSALGAGALLALVASAANGAVPATVTVAQAAGSATPNRFDPISRAASTAGPRLAQAASTSRRPAAPGHPAAAPPAAGRTATVSLDPSKPGHLTSADSALDLDVPAGAVSAGDVAAAGGAMSLLVRQVAPAAGGSAGGSGHFTFGTYLVQALDAGGRLARQGLRQPLGVTLHYAGRAGALDVSHAVAVINRPAPRSVSLDPASAGATPAAGAGRAPAAASGLGRVVTRTPKVDAGARTLTVTAPASAASTTVSFDTVAPVAAFGGPDRAQANLGAGALTLPMPLRLPAGPGGLTPPLGLSYDSAAVSGQHNPQAPAGWVGEGWNLSLGRISWAERDTALGCCPNPDFNDTWELVDGFGTMAELIPPSRSVSTFYDDFNGTAITPGPVAWHTTPETHARVVSFTGPNALPGMAAVPPCFRVFLPSGIMEEFGCTPDSLQFWPQSSGPNTGLDYIANWLVDLITDPRGNQIHVTYQQDVQTGAAGIAYPRDAVMATVEYDSPGCHNAQAACAGASWAPLMRVSFQASHSVAHVAGSSCAPSGSLRCDDPVDLAASGGLPAPAIEDTFVLNDAQVQVRSSGGAAWSTLRDYQLAYDQSPPTTISDPFSGVAESTAGRLDLTRLTEIGADGTTALPSRSFGYSRQTQLYEDSAWGPAPATLCGFSWNVGNGQGCNLWSQSYESNSYYLSTASNGLGLQQGFSWQNARDNSWNVPSGGDPTNPFLCNGAAQSVSPCDVADDQAWSRTVLTQRTETVTRLSQAGQGGAQTGTPVTSTYSYDYRTGPVSSYWSDFFDADVVDFYNEKFMGFNSATVTNPDGSREVHRYPATLGVGVFDPNDPKFSGSCTASKPCTRSPWWDPANAEHGSELEVDRFNTDGSLASVVQTQYRALCPSSGVAGDEAGNLVSELDTGNQVALCDIAPVQVDRFQVDGGSQASAPHLTTAYAYDAFGRTVATTETSSDGAGTGSPTTIVRRASYTWNDSVAATAGSATGTYLVDVPGFADVEDSAGSRYQCRYASYDGQGNVLGQTAGLRFGEPTRTDTFSSCGTAANGFAPSGQISTAHTYDALGNLLSSDDADALAGMGAHVGCTVGGVAHSTCSTLDGTFGTLPTSTANALGQTVSTSYQAPAAGTATGGFGTWPVAVADANGQRTTFAYDALGRRTGESLPGEGAGLTTKATAYTVWCAATGAQSPCVEIDGTQRLNGSTTVTSRAFYDGLGHLVETRSPAPGGQDVVKYSLYDASQRLAFQSEPYFVAAYTGGPGAAAYSIPDSTRAGATTTYDGLGRVTGVTDALSHTIGTAYSIVCGAPGTGDAACYEQKLTVDPSGHRGAALLDALGRTDYEQRYTGSSAAGAALYATITYTYDFVGDLTRILHPNGATTTTMRYDMTGRKTATTDPDAGTQSYVYDPAGNLVQSSDARGAAGTVFYGYDGIGRPLWHNTQNSPAGAYYTYSYDSTAGGSAGAGRLTGETFSAGASSSLAGSYTFTYDARGQQTGRTIAVAGATYTLGATFDDAGNQLTQTYPDGETVTNAYTAQGWLSGVTTQKGGTTTTLLSGAAYTGAAGAFGEITGAGLGSAYQYSAADDLLGRASDRRVTAGTATLFDQALTYDGAGNVATASTTLAAGTDNQAFCYDEQNRLTWAGSTGTAPCTGAAVAAGTLAPAQYTQSFTYDPLGRLATGPLGSYGYADPAHVHATTAVGSGYTATYDAAGNMTCRAPDTTSTCAGASPSGAQLGYGSESQLMSWQSSPSNPATSDRFLYDCQGKRVAQQVTQGGVTTTTVYIGGLEEITTSGGATTVKTYYQAAGRWIAMAVDGVFSYLATDGLGSATVVLGAGGGTVAGRLYTPYGAVRYSSGAVPTTYGFTGQRSDPASGLYYYQARYYDPAAGQFTSADSVVPGGGFNLEGLSRYAYTRGNPTSRTDPTGHDDFGGGFDFSGGGFDFSGGFDTGGSNFDSFNIDPSAANFIGNDFSSGGFDNAGPSTGDAAPATTADAVAPGDSSASSSSQGGSWWSSAVSTVGNAVSSWMGQVSDTMATTDGENMMVTQDQVDAARNIVSGAGEAIANAASAVNDTYQVTDGENMMVTQQELDACKSSGCSAGISGDVTFICSCLSGGGGSWGVNLQYTADNGLQLFTYSTESNPSAGFQVGAGVQGNFALGHGEWSGPFDQAGVSLDIVTLGGFRSSDGVSNASGYQGIAFGLGPGLPGAGYTTTNYTCRLGC
jgi:RHS repeat-associated protein